MTKTKLFLLFLLLPAMAWAANDGDNMPAALRVTTLRLANGLTVWINEDHSQPKVYGAVVVKAGANQCPGTGIAHYFEHLMFKGTQHIGTTDYANEKPWLDSISYKYDQLAATKDPSARQRLQRDINRLSLRAADYAIPNEFNNLISRFGGSQLNAYTSYDETVYHNVFSPQYLSQWLELNSERLIDPVFRLFQGELETVYEEKNRATDNLLYSSALKAAESVFAGTPYAQPILGTTENLKNPQLSRMRHFFNDYYVAGNMGLVLCGDLCADSVRGQLEATFGRIRPGNAPAQPPYAATPFDGTQTVGLKIPIPIVKAVALAFHAPTDRDADYVPLRIATLLLSNDTESGLLDSLGNESKVLAAIGATYSFKEQGVAALGAVPNLPFGSKKKAERLLWQQVERLQKGDFSDATFQAVRQEAVAEAEKSLESIDSRAAMMVTAFSHGFAWDDYVRRQLSAGEVTKADIMRVATAWLQPSKSLRFVKKTGSYPKDHVGQPGYTPVSPRHATAQSDYARQIERQPVAQVAPRYADYDRDAEHETLTPLVTLYRVENPVNDLFTLSFRFHRDATKDKRQWVAADYIGDLGTDSLTKQQLASAFAQIGAKMAVASDREGVTISLEGIDKNLAPTLRLTAHFISRMKPDKRKMADMVKGMKIADRTFFKENDNIFAALMAKVAYGDRSPYLDRATASDVKAMGSQAPIDAFHDALHAQCDIIYTGRLSKAEVEQALRAHFDLAKVTQRYAPPAERPLQGYAEPVVYVYDNPQARQILLGNYQQLPAGPTAKARQTAALWAGYFGGGMSSVLFQHIREYRSLAYSAHARLLAHSMKLYPDSHLAFSSSIGTQADKAMAAIGCLDSLLGHLPESANNFATTKQEQLNQSLQGYPGFRDMGATIAAGRLKGYDKNPNPAFDEALRSLTEGDMLDYYRRNIQGKPRVYVVVGDKKALDLERLAQYGKVVEVTQADIYR